MAGPKPANAYSLRRFIIPALFLGLVFAGYFRGRGESELVTELAGDTMGTTWNVKVVGDHADFGPQIQVVLDSVDRDLSTYKPDSKLSLWNAGGSWTVQDAYRPLFETSAELSRLSGGAFDITVRPLVALWGFGAGAYTEAPSKKSVDDVVFGWERVGFDDQGRLLKDDPAIQVDLSAIAKGFAVDRVAMTLDLLGPEGFMVEVGDEVRTSGTKHGQPWRIGIERPDEEGRVAQTVLELDGSLATSGDYRQYIEDDTGRRSHTIDPRTRLPIAHNLASVSVLADSCMLADAWATTLNVLGPDDGIALANQQGLAVLMLVRTDEGFEERRSDSW